MNVLWVSDDKVEGRDPQELTEMLDGPGIVWVDVPDRDDDAAVLSGRFSIHERAAADSARRNPVPKVPVYPGHVFVVLHAPERGARGHVHYVELDQFIGPDWLITVHGPVNPAVRPEVALEETRAVARRLESGRLRPTSAADLSYAVVTALTGRMRDLLVTLTEEVWQLERQVTAGMGGDPQQFPEELFAVRHGLLAIRTMAALSREVYGRMATLGVWPGAGHAMLFDLEDQFRRIFAMAEGQRGGTAGRDRRGHTPGDGPVVDPRDERHRQREPTRRPARRPARGDGRHVHGAAHLGPPQGLVVSDHRRRCHQEPPAARWPETPTRPLPPRRCWRDGGTGPR